MDYGKSIKLCLILKNNVVLDYLTGCLLILRGTPLDHEIIGS
jgi:hypothetical protein